MSFSLWPVTEELKEYIINGFNIIKKSNYNYKQKSAALNQLLSLGAGAGWRPKAITIGAIKLFVDNNFKKPKGLERAHEFHRRDTIKILIEKNWKNDEWWEWFYHRDFTILSTRNENRDEKNFNPTISSACTDYDFDEREWAVLSQEIERERQMSLTH